MGFKSNKFLFWIIGRIITYHSANSILGSPPPNLTWYKGHELIDDQDQTKNGRTINILTLAEPVQKKDAGAIYTCQAVNNNQSIPVATKLKLEIACK